MNRIAIAISNCFQSLRFFARDSNLKRLLWLEGIVFFAALGMMFYNLSATPRNFQNNADNVKLVQTNRDEISNLPSEFFYIEKAPVAVKAPVVFAKMFLTGIGKVNGVYKGSIEDAEGNYYYVREGDSVKGLLVKKIGGQEVVLTDKSGNNLVLRLER